MPHPIQHLVMLEPTASRFRRRSDRRLKPQRPSKAAEMWYRAALFALVAHLTTAGAAVAEELRASWPRARSASDEATVAISTVDPILTARDAAPPRFEAVLGRAAAKFGGIREFARGLVDGTGGRPGVVARNVKAVDEQLARSVKRSIGLDVSPVLRPGRRIQQAMEKASAENIALITSMPAKYLARVEDVVTENWNEGRRWEDMAAGIARAGKITKNRANVIARDQTSKMTAAFNEARQQQIGIKRYVWRDCGIYTGPHRVRPSHQLMNGRVCEWAHPPEVDGELVHPGEPVLCRCSAEPIVNLDLLEADDSEAAA